MVRFGLDLVVVVFTPHCSPSDLLHVRLIFLLLRFCMIFLHVYLLVPSLGTQSLKKKVLSLRPGVGENAALHASPVAMNSAGLFFAFLGYSTSLFLMIGPKRLHIL